MLPSRATRTRTMRCGSCVRFPQISCMTVSADPQTSAQAAQPTFCQRGLAAHLQKDRRPLHSITTRLAVVRTITSCCCHAWTTGSGGQRRGGKGTFSTGTTSKSQRAIHSAWSSTAGSNIKRGGASQRGRDGEKECVFQCLVRKFASKQINSQKVLLMEPHTLTNSGSRRGDGVMDV